MMEKPLWKTPGIDGGKPFRFAIECYQGTDIDLYRRTIEKKGLGIPVDGYNHGFVFVAEWGYSFTHLDGQVDGSGRAIKAGYETPPANRAEALEVIREFLMREYIKGRPHPWISMNGHYPWHHYAGEFGFDQLCSEIGENINNYQWHIAVNRGAARQYRKPWTIDFSPWHGPSITDYSAAKHWGEYSMPHGGHSMSLLERAYYMAYMSGANEIVAEGGAPISVLDELDGDGLPLVSPYGEVGKRVFDFSKGNPDVGVCFTPFALVVDYYHGMYSGFDGKKAFYHFDYTPGDELTWSIVDMFFPGGWEVIGQKEKGAMVNGPYGDTMDVLLQNAPLKLLKHYPCVILSGDIHFNEGDVGKFLEYAAGGGKLILNRAYLPNFESAEANDNIILYGGKNYSTDGLDDIIREQLAVFIPFTVAPGVEAIYNITPDGWILTLINNDGVTKDCTENVVIDNSFDREVTVKRTDGRPMNAHSLLSGNACRTDSGAVRVFLKAGGYDIIKIEGV
jgi:hypothetical protein